MDITEHNSRGRWQDLVWDCIADPISWLSCSRSLGKCLSCLLIYLWHQMKPTVLFNFTFLVNCHLEEWRLTQSRSIVYMKDANTCSVRKRTSTHLLQWLDWQVTRLGKILPFGYFLEAQVNFRGQKLLHFWLLFFSNFLQYLPKQSMVYCRYFKVSKVYILGSQIELWCRYFGIFGAVLVWATFPKSRSFLFYFLSLTIWFESSTIDKISAQEIGSLPKGLKLKYLKHLAYNLKYLFGIFKK